MSAVSVLGALPGAPAGAARSVGGRGNGGALFEAALGDAGRILATATGAGTHENELAAPGQTSAALLLAEEGGREGASDGDVRPDGGALPIPNAPVTATLLDTAPFSAPTPVPEVFGVAAVSPTGTDAAGASAELAVNPMSTASVDASQAAVVGASSETSPTPVAGATVSVPASAPASRPMSAPAIDEPVTLVASAAAPGSASVSAPTVPPTTAIAASPAPGALSDPRSESANPIAAAGARPVGDTDADGRAIPSAGGPVVADRSVQTQASAGAATAPVPGVAPTVAAPVAAISTVAPSDPAANVPRAVAAQVSPVIVSIAQRPAGDHQLTMTVDPDSLGPVTLRAHIGRGGDVQVELVGATDAGRDALRVIVADLRRDLAAVMPHATLSLGSASGADAGASDRGAASHPGGEAGDRAPGGRESGRGETARRTADLATDRAANPTTPADVGAGLDTFA